MIKMMTYLVDCVTCLKVGKSRRLDLRLAMIKFLTKNEVTLLIYVNGDYEKQVLDYLKPFAINGREWLRRDCIDKALEYFKRLKENPLIFD